MHLLQRKGMHRHILCKARKSLEHDTFVDLRKAYDSMPCAAMWHVLEKYGIPPASSDHFMKT